jgi:hypothetical protein
MTPLRAALALSLAFSAAACGSSPRPPVEDAVRSYSGAFLSGQGVKAADMLSARCNTPTLRQQIIQASMAASALYGQARLVSVTPTVDGGRATVTYRFDQPEIDLANVGRDETGKSVQRSGCQAAVVDEGELMSPPSNGAASRCGRPGSAMSQIQIKWSLPAVAMMGAAGPVSGGPIAFGCAGSAMFQRRTVWSALAVTRTSATGLNETLLT